MKLRLRNRFRLSVAAQVAGLAATLLLFAYTAIATDFAAVPVTLAVVILLQVALLLHSVERHVDTLEDFFAAINYEDLTRHYVVDDVDAELKTAFNRIIDRFRSARAERDLQADYLDTVMRHVPVPIAAVRADGRLRLVNAPMKRMTGLASLRSLDDFGELDPALPDKLRGIDAGQQRLLQARFRDLPVELRVSVSEIRFGGESERIYSIENLTGELSARESSAWRNLIRVLTHEIMNSLTPVASLAETTATMTDADVSRDDLKDALSTIARRSRGLVHFVERYRELMQVPAPRPESLGVRSIIDEVLRLMAKEIDGVQVDVDVTPRTLKVTADRALLDQVLVNLLRNAVQATASTADPAITLRGRLQLGRTLIQVSDNGPGFEAGTEDQIFVPFFTTRREGSGIGLSVSRQIMLAHGGDLLASSDEHGATLTMLF
ncbi:MAG: ATP-binding protein [Woeseiaceae bacterium]|nr:ATP-binding protein [Woeseiaceae bacterium]